MLAVYSFEIILTSWKKHTLITRRALIPEAPPLDSVPENQPANEIVRLRTKYSELHAPRLSIWRHSIGVEIKHLGIFKESNQMHQ